MISVSQKLSFAPKGLACRTLILLTSFRSIITVVCLLLSGVFTSLRAATLPLGFAETQVASGISKPTAMDFAPDGRLFVCLQGGQLRVIKGGTLLTTPFLTVNVDSSGERGLLGVAFDPIFPVNNFVYIYYTVTSLPAHNRVSRFTANGDVALPNSEVVLLDLDDLSAATTHNGGAIHFGPDGKLYVGVGENGNSSNSQTLGNLLGKVLRINADGSIPQDNPFYNTATGINRGIWSLGLRNPFTFAFQPGTGFLFINDVGEETWEEINEGVAGSNYGWPVTEGPTSDPRFRGPMFAYRHGSGGTTGCAIAGGSFYNPTAIQFPASYVGKYFFADLCNGWIRILDPSNSTAANFATGVLNPVDLKVAADGSLYYLSRGSAAVFKIQYVGCAGSNAAGVISKHAAQESPPILETEENTDSAIAFDSMTMLRDPFPLINPLYLGSDNRTRVTLFAVNLDLLPCEDSSSVKAQAEDAQHNIYPLTVEFVGKIPGFEWLREVIVRLPDNLSANQDVLVSITWHAMTSNKARVAIR